MEKIKELIKTIVTGVVSDPQKFSSLVTREAKEVVLLDFTDDCSVLMVLKSGDASQQSSVANLPSFGTFDKTHVKVLNEGGKVLLSVTEVRKSKQRTDKSVVLTGVWAQNPIASMLLYTLSLRIWQNIIPKKDLTPSIESILSTYATSTNQAPGEGDVQIYSCTSEASKVDITGDIIHISQSDLINDDVEGAYKELLRALSKSHQDYLWEHSQILRSLSGGLGPYPGDKLSESLNYTDIQKSQMQPRILTVGESQASLNKVKV